VDIENHAAIYIYKKLGFVKTGHGFREQDNTYISMRYDPNGKDADTLMIPL